MRKTLVAFCTLLCQRNGYNETDLPYNCYIMAQAKDLLRPFVLGFIWLYRKLILALAATVLSGYTKRRVRESFAKASVNVHPPREGEKEAQRSTIISINGNENHNKWDIRVKDNRFYSHLASQPFTSLELSYLNGWYECDDLAEMFFRLLSANVEREALFFKWELFLLHMEMSFFNNQDRRRAYEVGRKHYDIGNDLYEAILDTNMIYSCSYWINDEFDLNDAQMAKMELIAQKLQLKPGMRVLDIGCGWGGLMRHLAQKYGVTCVGVTVSEKGMEFGKEFCKGLPVEFRLCDYRDLNEQFDRIVSVGMFEHVGLNNYKTYFEVSHRCLKPDGIFLLHTMAIASSSQYPRAEPFAGRIIFPNGILPSLLDVTSAFQDLYVLEDCQNFGYYYYKTITAWFNNLLKNKDKLTSTGRYDESFFRLWTVFLQGAGSLFRSRKVHVYQFVLTQNGMKGGYVASRWK